MTKHKIGYTEKMLQTILIEGMREEQEGHNKKAQTKQKRMEKDENKFKRTRERYLGVYRRRKLIIRKASKISILETKYNKR